MPSNLPHHGGIRRENRRFVIERFYFLASMLRHGTPFTMGEVASGFECSVKTIQRDLDFMRDRLGWGFFFSPASKRWVLTKAPTPVL